MKCLMWTLLLGAILVRLNAVPPYYRYRRWIPERLTNADYGVDSSYVGGASTYDSYVPSRHNNYQAYYWGDYSGGSDSPGDYSGLMFRANDNSYSAPAPAPYDPVQQLYNVQQYAYLQTLQQSPYYNGPLTMDNFDYNAGSPQSPPASYNEGYPPSMETPTEGAVSSYAGRANMRPMQQRQPVRTSVLYSGASYAPTSYSSSNQYLRMPSAPIPSSNRIYSSVYQAPVQQEKPAAAQSRNTAYAEEPVILPVYTVQEPPVVESYAAEEPMEAGQSIYPEEIPAEYPKVEVEGVRVESITAYSGSGVEEIPEETVYIQETPITVEITPQEYPPVPAEEYPPVPAEGYAEEEIVEERAHHELLNYPEPAPAPAPMPTPSTNPAADILSSPLDLIYPGTTVPSASFYTPPYYQQPPQQQQYPVAPPQYTASPQYPPQNSYVMAQPPPPQDYSLPYNPLVNYGDVNHLAYLPPMNSGYNYNYNYNGYQPPAQYQTPAYQPSYNAPYSAMAPRYTRSQSDSQQRTVVRNPVEHQRQRVTVG